MAFYVGDIVEVIENNWNDVPIGTIGKIVRIDSDGDLVIRPRGSQYRSSTKSGNVYLRETNVKLSDTPRSIIPDEHQDLGIE